MKETPPLEALNAIKDFCKTTQCRNCHYGQAYHDTDEHYVACRLMDDVPCDWKIPKTDQK